MEFTLIRQSEPVNIKGEDGRILNCTLKEITGEERTRYVSSMLSKMRVDAQGKTTGLKTYEGVETDLVMMALHGPDGKTFTKKEIDAFPASMLSALYEAAQRLSGLDNKAEELAKND